MRETWWYVSFGDFTGRGGVFSGATAEAAVERAGADIARAAAIGPIPPGGIPEGHPLNVVLTVEEVAANDPDGEVELASRDELLDFFGDFATDWRN